jgi:hypothetical protein
MQTGAVLCHLFATMLTQCVPTQSLTLWEEFHHNVCDDLPHLLCSFGCPSLSTAEVYDYGLYLLDRILHDNGCLLQDFPPMPLSWQNWGATVVNALIAEQLNYDQEQQLRNGEHQVTMLNHEQTAAYEAILDSIDSDHG